MDLSDVVSAYLFFGKCQWMLIGIYQPVACGDMTTKNVEIIQKLHSVVFIISIQKLWF